MKPSEVLKQMKELKETWRKQSFSFTSSQQAEYNRLLGLRRERVREMYANDLVYKGGTKQLVNPK
tara:strand:- start:239 stop:433 length:195 start_codon:yes stop_codon:yes gene_type:complete